MKPLKLKSKDGGVLYATLEPHGVTLTQVEPDGVYSYVIDLSVQEAYAVRDWISSIISEEYHASK